RDRREACRAIRGFLDDETERFQQIAQHGAVRGLVVGDENAPPRSAIADDGTNRRGRGGDRTRLGQREVEPEARAAAWRAFDVNRAAEQFGDSLRDRQAESGALRGGGSRRLMKRL